MPLPEPVPGLVIGYRYLWADEQDRGADDGSKTRPCAIVLVRRVLEGRNAVTVVPITHAPPGDREAALAIPPAVNDHLGLDDGRSWAVLSEVNTFLWPGPDLAPIRRSLPGTFHYGALPPAFFRTLRDQLIALATARRTRAISRSD